MYFLKKLCENSDFLQIVQVIWNIIRVFFVVVPIILILMISLDFAKNVIANSEDVAKKNLQVVLKRIISAVAVFLVPIIVQFSMSLLGNLGVSYADCINNATSEKIEYFKQLESEEKEQQSQSNSDNSTSEENNSSSYNDGSNSGENSSNTNISILETDTSGLKAGVDFTKINQCNRGKVIATSNGAKLRECVIGYKTAFFSKYCYYR